MVFDADKFNLFTREFNLRNRAGKHIKTVKNNNKQYKTVK